MAAVLEFSIYSVAKQSQTAAAAATKGLTPEEVLMLPSGPHERTAKELDRFRLGGGFRSYDSRRQGGFQRDTDREIAPSRADETDDWGAAKKTLAGNGFERRGRELMNLIIGQRIKLLYPLLVEDLIGEGVLGQTVVIPIRIGGPKERKRKVDRDLPPVVVHSTV
ncbi:hypothetical protein R3W88_030221 [Solanum pinnatisectum]|uniref:Uncharacterized protein n=1 Tax=Solanum pinnatisectum TaxID=50273 RepID=A0AAV9K7Y9_9SOLN|nr:hypothetical protein R3W88_030221 [Solanum pinnatisectum]